MRKIILLVLLFPLVAVAQTPARYDQPAITTTSNPVQPGALPNVLAVTNATIAVCGFPATLVQGMCTNTITTYTDSTLSTACPSTAQLTAPGTKNCVPTSGLQGSFGFWYDASTQTHMTYTIKTNWGTFGPYDILIPVGGASAGNPAGPAFAVNIANSSVNAFAADPNITINPTTHNLSSPALNSVAYVLPSFTRGGTDIGDEINKAYAALPATGGT